MISEKAQAIGLFLQNKYIVRNVCFALDTFKGLVNAVEVMLCDVRSLPVLKSAVCTVFIGLIVT